MQTVPLSYISNGPLSVLPLTIPNEVGYAPRYIDYKTDIDTSIGAFKTSLKNWVISYDNQSLDNQFGFDIGLLNYLFLALLILLGTILYSKLIQIL